MLASWIVAAGLCFPAQEEPATNAPEPGPASEVAESGSTGAKDGRRPDVASLERSFTTLAAIEASRASKRKALKDARERLANSSSDDERADLFEEIRGLQAELERIDADYESIVTGIDVEEFDLAPSESFDLQEELSELVQPIVEELKQATEAPRQIERLRSDVTYYEERLEQAHEALASVEELLAKLPVDDPRDLRPGLESSRDGWRKRIEDIERERAVARFQLENRLAQRTSILESTQGALANFFRTRGLNLLVAIATFFVVLLGLRALYRRAKGWFGGKQNDERAFYARLIDVVFLLSTGTLALLATLLVLYATGDWVLLGIVLMFLLGLAWASKTAIPPFLEQIRLLLNLGSVRERERVIVDGVPYRVSKLSFYTLLSNPELAGGVRRFPVRSLMSMHSRTCSKDELWFPCRRGDWVLLADGKRGKVLHQGPDEVQIELLGGSRVTYRTTDFLALAPQNQSSGFRVHVTFGIDYAHQPIATTEVPTKLAERVRAGLLERYDEGVLLALRVEFQAAGASSLDLSVLADFDGSVARDYDALHRAIQRLCVETCNDEGWVIPFTQVTLHQAEPG